MNLGDLQVTLLDTPGHVDFSAEMERTLQVLDYGIPVSYTHLDVYKRQLMEKLISRKEAAKLLGISIATLDAARNSGLISYVQYVQNGCVYFTDAGLQEYIAKCTHRAKPMEKSTTFRKPRSARG